MAKSCANCGAELSGLYCSRCGQKDEHLREPFWKLVGHFTADFWHFDSKFFRTMGPLLFKPGFLTKEFIAGKRSRYMKPVQMYFFISVIFFLLYFTFLSPALNTNALLVDNPAANLADSTLRQDSSIIKKLSELKPFIAARLVDSLNREYKNRSQPNEDILNTIVTELPSGENLGISFDDNLPKTIVAYEDSISQLSPDSRPSFVMQALTKKMITLKQRAYEEGEKSLLTEILDNFLKSMPKLIFILLPVFALIMKLFYIRRKIYLVDHAIFTLHFHSFAFLLFLIVGIFGLITGINIPVGFILLLLAVYLAISLRFVYRQSWKKTILKETGISVFYFFSMVVVALLGLIISALAVGGNH